MGELVGKVAVITGAGSGMTRATAKIFVREGARVLGADISGREKETADELGDAFVPFHGDVSNEEDVEAMFAAALDAFAKVDIACNVAGIGGHGKVADVTVEEYERIMNVNLLGVILGTKHAVRTMLPTGGGVILNWSSTGGMNGSRQPVGVYSASKAGVISYTKQAAIEKFPALVQGAPMGRAAEPEEIAEVACFLASDRASFVTGAVIPIDGGITATMPS